MPNFTIYIRNPYPFRWEETQALQAVLREVYGGEPVYLKEWPIDWVSVDKVNKATAQQVAKTVRCFHRQAGLRDKNTGYYRAEEMCRNPPEVEVREQGEERPEWAKQQRATQ